MSRKHEQYTIIGHLNELRKRLLISVICIISATLVSFAFVDRLRGILILPAGDIQLVFITPPEALMADFRLAILAGIALSLPVLIYQMIAFLLPALEKDEKRLIIPGVFAVMLFFCLGVSFAYFVVFPFAVRFFLTFASSELLPMFTISNYLSFAMNFIFAFGVVFQMPLLFYVLGRLNIVHAPFLRQYRRHALLIIVIVSAFLTPPDVFSQLMMAGPLYGLYELGIILVVFSQRKGKKQDDNDNDDLM